MGPPTSVRLASRNCIKRILKLLCMVTNRPVRPVSWNQGTLRPSWFNIWNLPPVPSEYDEESMKKSVSTIQGFIREQIEAGMDAGNIFLMGFSQGAATSLCAGLTLEDEIGGVVSLSGWIPEAHRHASPTHSLIKRRCLTKPILRLFLVRLRSQSYGAMGRTIKRFPSPTATMLKILSKHCQKRALPQACMLAWSLSRLTKDWIIAQMMQNWRMSVHGLALSFSCRRAATVAAR